MTEEKAYRHEYKYPISDTEARIISERMRFVMSPDQHTGPDGRYHISSLYFDDCFDSCFLDNENGTDPREKFRIRIYNNSTDRISLECKRKERGKTLKSSCLISVGQVREILEGKVLAVTEDSDPLLKKFAVLQAERNLKPKVIVEYDRLPFVYKAGNVRITLDSQLSSSTDVTHFLDGGYSKRPVMPVGQLLLEVKFDAFLPDWLYASLQLNNLTQTAFSKYYLCRKFGIGR